MQDTAYLFKLLNSACTSMFAMFRELELPEEIIDQIINNNPKGLENAVGYLKQAQISNSEKTIRATAISWAINTIAICGQCGMKLEKDLEKERSVVTASYDHN
jgi:hypothetical protein